MPIMSKGTRQKFPPNLEFSIRASMLPGISHDATPTLMTGIGRLLGGIERTSRGPAPRPALSVATGSERADSQFARAVWRTSAAGGFFDAM